MQRNKNNALKLLLGENQKTKEATSLKFCKKNQLRMLYPGKMPFKK